MPLPEAARTATEFSRRLRNLEAGASMRLVDAYGPIWLRLRSDINSLVNEALDKELSASQVFRLNRYQDLLARVDREMARYGATAVTVTSEAQTGALTLSELGAQQTVARALPRGLTLDILENIGLGWNNLPVDAFNSFIGISGDGAPLGRLLEPLGQVAKDGITQSISDGIARGLGPRQTAALIRQRFGVPLSRSLGISITETNRAYREANRLQYQNNSDVVKGYERLSARDSRVCMACIALDGTFYPLDKPLNEHSRGRCALVPVTISYKDLGLDVEEAPAEMQSAREWFLKQPEGVQRQMMGPGKFKAFKANEFEFNDLAKLTQSSVWGEAAVETPLKELVG